MDLVTGGTGIVGVHVLNELLDRGRKVRALHRAGSDRDLVLRVLRHYHADGDARFHRIDWAEGDLLEPDALRAAMRGVERVFHCAALVSFDPRDAERMFLHNITGTANVVNAMLESGVSRLGHVSSTATIGFRPDGSANDERVEFKRDKSASAYAISKHEAELEVQRGIAEGLHAVMVNPCVVIGPGPAGRSSMTIMERMRKGSRFFPRGSNAVVDARDVATALVRLMDKGAVGERHLLIGENISYRNLFTTIAETAGLAAPTIPLPPWVLGLAWRAERLRTLFGGRPMITKVSARTASRPRLYDGSKARRLLDMEFRRAKEAVENTERFLRAQ
jgi:dihydroflavonol-4-reductase